MHVLVKWWLRQLASLMPARIAELWAKSPDAALLAVEYPRLNLGLRRRGEVQPLQQFRADADGFAAAAAVAAGQKDRPRRTLLQLPAAQALHKELSLPLAAETDLATLIGYEMDRETPFSRDEVYWGYRLRQRDAARGRLSVDLFVLPQSSVARLLSFAQDAGFALDGIELDFPADAPVHIAFDSATPSWTWQPTRPTLALAAVAGCLLLAALAGPFVRQHFARTVLDRDIASLTLQAQEASTLRRSIDQLTATQDFVGKERAQNRDALTVLALLTKTLPDDTHLTAFSYRNGKLILSGVSPSAATLIPLLSKTPPFRDPTFASPVVENADDGLETFTITVSMAAASAS